MSSQHTCDGQEWSNNQFEASKFHGVTMGYPQVTFAGKPAGFRPCSGEWLLKP